MKKPPRRTGNPKRSFVSRTDWQNKKDVYATLAKEVCYDGKPEHKDNPGDFGLTPPRDPRQDKTLCDVAGIFLKAVASELLRKGIQLGLVDTRVNKKNFPRHVWAVHTDEKGEKHVLEGKPSYSDKGFYHGYPLLEGDALRQTVLNEWERRNGTL